MVIDGAYEVVKSFQSVNEHMAMMKEIPLTPAMADAYAEAALSLRYDTEEKAAPVTVAQVLEPRRAVDNSPDLWSTFNRVQENLVRGGLSATAAHGRAQSMELIRTSASTGLCGPFRNAWPNW